MILLSLVLVLGSAGLLIAGLGAGDHHLIWGSMVASLLAAACLAVAVFRRRAPVPVAAGPDRSRSENSRLENVQPDRERIDSGAAGTDAPAVESSTAESALSQVLPPPVGSAALDQPEPVAPADEPAEEEASSTDVLRILDLLDEVMVVDERPRYHLPECVHLIGKDAQPLPISEARGAGFSPCALCRPDGTLADRSRGGS